jgi:hypothetical protein
MVQENILASESEYSNSCLLYAFAQEQYSKKPPSTYKKFRQGLVKFLVHEIMQKAVQDRPSSSLHDEWLNGETRFIDKKERGSITCAICSK